MAITDLTNTVWEFTSLPSYATGSNPYLGIKNINFYSNKTLYSSIAQSFEEQYEIVMSYGGASSVQVFNGLNSTPWVNNNYKTINIIGGADVADSALITFLGTYATNRTSEYLTNNSEIASIADAIRIKGSTSSSLIYPSDFITAIQNIPTGGSSYTLLYSGTTTVSNYTSTSATTHVTISPGSQAHTSNSILYVKIRDTAGMRAGHFLGSDSYCFNYQAANGSTSNCTYWVKNIHRKATGGTLSTYTAGTSIGYGLYPYSVANNGNINIYKRYNSSYSLTIDGTYSIEVYLLDYIDNPFNFTASV